jgi:hypothetical protein
MTMPSLPLPLAEQVTANQNLLHAALLKVVRNLKPVEQVKATANLKPLPVVPHAEPAESKILMFPVMKSDREPS